MALPWHRVLLSSGRSAFAPGSADFNRQRRRLAREGVVMIGGRVPLAARSPRAALDALLWGAGD
jgi:methylated-DNA-protein-cysteine methyltransferase-like protein